MPFPALIAEAVGTDYALGLGYLASTQECEASKYHSPTPLIVKHYVMDPEWGFETISDEQKYHGELATAWLCGTCADNVALYLRLLDNSEGDLDWPIRREFGNLIRTVGDRAWQCYLQFKGNEKRVSP